MRTKIVATLGPASDNERTLRELLGLGVRIFRLNFSHGGAEMFADIVALLRRLEEEKGSPLTLLQDLSGPKIRTCESGGESGGEALEIARHDEVLLGPPGLEGQYQEPYICLDLPDVLESLRPGDRVALSDGMIQFEVVGHKTDTVARMVAMTEGIAPPRKGIIFPGKSMPLAALTSKDKADLAAGIELGVDAVAMSYVQTPDDILDLRQQMKSLGTMLPIIAKLERPTAIQNLDRIIDLADGVMVARGDLGLETPLASLPGLQKSIIRACNQACKPVIVATQMLLSMVRSPMPTRAETTDVANAILDGADCLMLSEETAIGHFPVEAVSYMQEIAGQAEDFYFAHRSSRGRPEEQEHPAKFLAYASCLLADKTRAKAVICHSMSGSSARILAACKPRQTVYALSPDSSVRHFLNFSAGVIPSTVGERITDHLDRAQGFVDASPSFAKGDTVVITAGQPRPEQTTAQTNLVKIYVK